MFTVAPLVFVLELRFRESLPLSPARWEDSRRQAGRGRGNLPRWTPSVTHHRELRVFAAVLRRGGPTAAKALSTLRWTDANSQTCSACLQRLLSRSMEGGGGEGGGSIYLSLSLISHFHMHNSLLSLTNTFWPDAFFFFFFVELDICCLQRLSSGAGTHWGLMKEEVKWDSSHFLLCLPLQFTGRTNGNHVRVAPLLIFKS